MYTITSAKYGNHTGLDSQQVRATIWPDDGYSAAHRYWGDQLNSLDVGASLSLRDGNDNLTTITREA